MKNNVIKYSLSAIACLAWACEPSLHAAAIFQDSFNGNGELNGQTPTVTTGGATWTGVAGIYTESGGATTFNAGANTAGFNAPFASLAYAGTNLLNSTTYVLSLDVNFTNAPGDRWTGIGFTTSATGGDAFATSAAWMLNKGTGSDIQYFVNNFGASGTATGAGASVTTLSISLAIDGAGAGSVTYRSNGVALNVTPLTLTSGQVDGIQGVGFFKYQDAAGTYDNFSFSSVPEPSTWVMMLGGLGLLVGMQRLRSRRA